MSNPNDDDRLRLLSDAERQAMADDNDEYDPDADNAAALAALGRGALDAEEEEDGDDDDAAKGKPEPGTPTDPTAPTDAPAAAAAAGTAGAATDPTSPTEPTQPTEPAASAAQRGQQSASYRVDLPADFDDQLKANRGAMAAARAKFNDGELDQGELDTELERLQDERDQLRDLKTRATVSAEMRQQSEQEAWGNTINGFMDDAAKSPELGIVDYRKDQAKQNDLDAMVRALAATPGNENKPMRWFLEEGHKRVVALHGIATTKKPADTRRRPDPSGVVQNLADVPGGAGDADPVSDEFAEVDKLEGLAYERALAAMSEEKRDRYNRLA